MNKAFAGVVGALLGGLVAFLLRPSAPLIGQLSFGAVVSRGRSLRGLDQILVPVAERSFNQLLVGLVLGGLAGLVLAIAVARGRRPDPR